MTYGRVNGTAAYGDVCTHSTTGTKSADEARLGVKHVAQAAHDRPPGDPTPNSRACVRACRSMN